MKIRHLMGIIALMCVLSMSAFGQTISGRITGIAVDPTDPAPPRTGGITYIITSESSFWDIATSVFFFGIR